MPSECLVARDGNIESTCDKGEERGMRKGGREDEKCYVGGHDKACQKILQVLYDGPTNGGEGRHLISCCGDPRGSADTCTPAPCTSSTSRSYFRFRQPVPNCRNAELPKA